MAAFDGPILGVWAHPDDEGYSMGGIMLRALAEGQRVVCLTATRGELGFPDDDPRSLAERGALRTAELKACLDVFGVTEHEFFDLPDGGCADVDPAGPVARIVEVLRELRPAHVFTFGPDGGTDHPDHKAACAWTTAAVEQAGVPTTLHYSTQTPEWMSEYFTKLEEQGVFMGFTPPATPADQLSWHCVLTDDELEVKLRAMLCQESQVRPLYEEVGEVLFRDLMRDEMFWSPG